MNKLVQRCLVEVLGTFLLAFTVLTTHNFLAIGSALAIGVFLGGGCYNPAVAIALTLNKEIKSSNLIFIILAEIVGASLAYFVATKL